VILLAMALQTASPPIVDWQPFPMQRSPDGGLFDRTTAKRTGDVVSAWVRPVNVTFKGVTQPREQTDARMEIDCRRQRLRVVAYRLVRADGTISTEQASRSEEATWRTIGIGTRGADVRTALCRRVR
jgi:hypothetical protein